MFPFDYTAVVGSGKVGPVNRLNTPIGFPTPAKLSGTSRIHEFNFRRVRNPLKSQKMDTAKNKPYFTLHPNAFQWRKIVLNENLTQLSIAVFAKNSPGADIEGSRGCPGLPLNFQNIHLREQHFQGVFLPAPLKNVRLASLAYYHIYLGMFRHYRSTILQIAFEMSRS